MNAPRSNGFSQIPHGFHERICELKGARLHVWLAHRCREGSDGESYPSLERLSQDTGLSVTTVKVVRKWLRSHGWLTSSGQKHTTQGRFSIPIEHTTMPPTVAKKLDHGTAAKKPDHGAAKKLDHGAAKKADDGLFGSEVDPAFEVDPDEVHPTTNPPLGLVGGLVETLGAPEADPTPGAGKAESSLTEDALWEGLQQAHKKFQDEVNDGVGPYDSMPTTPSVSGLRELFADVTKRGLIHSEDLPLICKAYEEWFGAEYMPSFVDVENARTAAEATGANVDAIRVKAIRYPLAVFRKKLTTYLAMAREHLEEESAPLPTQPVPSKIIRKQSSAQSAEWKAKQFLEDYLAACKDVSVDLQEWRRVHPVPEGVPPNAIEAGKSWREYALRERAKATA